MSTARNAGLDIAQGEWIGFVDPDDYVEPDMYEFLYRAATETHAEIAACSWRDCYANETIPYQKKRYYDTVSRGVALPREIRDSIFLTCNKIFYYKCIEHVRYKEGYINGEDRLFAVQAICNTDKVTYRFEDKYNYCHRKNSAGTKSFSIADYKLLDICKEIEQIFWQQVPDFIDIAYWQTALSCRRLLSMMEMDINRYPPYGEQVLSFLRSHWLQYIIKNKDVSFSEKLKLSLLAMSPYLYRTVRLFVQGRKKQHQLSN